MAKDLAKRGWGKTRQFASINIISDHLSDQRLYKFIEAQAGKHNIPFSIFSLEMTECHKVEDWVKARETLNQFYQAAIPLNLDDAGTGYGGLSYIQGYFYAKPTPVAELTDGLKNRIGLARV